MLKTGEKWAIDLSPHQHGWSETLTPLGLYKVVKFLPIQPSYTKNLDCRSLPDCKLEMEDFVTHEVRNGVHSIAGMRTKALLDVAHEYSEAMRSWVKKNNTSFAEFVDVKKMPEEKCQALVEQMLSYAVRAAQKKIEVFHTVHRKDIFQANKRAVREGNWMHRKVAGEPEREHWIPHIHGL